MNHLNGFNASCKIKGVSIESQSNQRVKSRSRIHSIFTAVP